MGLNDIKKDLKKLDKDELIGFIADLNKKNKSVKEYFDFYINPDEEKIFEKYREKVFEAFYPKRGFGFKLKDGRKAISDFKKLGVSLENLADLMLFYVETGVKFTNDFGDIDENFYSSLENMYVQALTLMKKEDFLDKFNDRAQQVATDTRGIGWGFHDYIMDVYVSFYPYDDDLDEKIEDEIDNQKNNTGKTIRLRKV